MTAENMVFSSKTVELSETKTYLELVNRVCFYGKPNLNGTELPSDTAEERAKTLIDMPIKAKYAVNKDGEPTFKGHEAYIDKDGDIAYDTEAIGVHTGVEIKNDDVEIDGEIYNLPCLFATQKIWTENKNVVAACKRLFEEGKLYNSWEVVFDKYEFENGIKRLIDYAFTANCFLGYEFAEPAYGPSAKVVSLSESDRLMVAEALSKDIINKQREEDAKMSKKDTSALTVCDLMKGLREAVSKELNCDIWDFDIIEVFPEEHICWVKKYPRKELDIIVVSYEVADDEVTATSHEGGELVVEISETETVISDLKGKINERSDSIIELNQDIDTLKGVIAELEPIKELYEAEQAAKAEAEKNEKIHELEAYVAASEAFTAEELESDEIKNLISEVKAMELKELIADRLVKKASEAREHSPKHEGSAVIKPEITGTGGESGAADIMRNFLK